MAETTPRTGGASANLPDEGGSRMRAMIVGIEGSGIGHDELERY